MAAPQVLTLTEAAAARVKALIAKSDKPVEGLRVGIKTRGCSGMSYVVEYAEEKKPFEDVVEDKGVKIFVDPSALMFILGSEMDYQEGKMQSGFVFTNPNETARCGCGESFSVGG
ncbi:MAG: iron-sulfur cluster assembly accessory protein [Caenispirillum bisanense]|uniref:Iron-sulfur cluster assembly protein n=1 Tax=Caenispirillum bisanense TaxID=414052 RepID=A0A286GKT0_9PROT|nr:iron-sulfur cluster assembly accessory protein [Caenispirillum bisanense]MCA1939853.1 iron-sulfur cluster assembly accessory protein [Caenispirillum bisanense]MCA1972528.1 iron-sulfur cluster assembly accessory protein [Caenispirillum sp.]SOD96143.1 iron-sulfur cluster assembly protein [Caenispirillum bisanense]